MAKITGTFDSFWQSLEGTAKDLGVTDGDLPQLRTSVKSVLVAAGWADPSGKTEFLSASDEKACRAAAETEVSRLAPALAQARQLVFTSGFHPTKNSLSAASAPVVTEMTSAQTVTSSFQPQMAKVGDSCPRCSGPMQAVGLVNDRSALYCPKDRVVEPLPVGVSSR